MTKSTSDTMSGETPGKTSDKAISSWVDLSAYNTLAIPALTKELCVVRHVEELQTCIARVKQENLPFLILGEGSNTVFLQDYDGVVVLNRLTGIELVSQTQSTVTVKVAAGENWHDFVAYCVSRQWYGIENLALIPGTVGAAPIQNIGAYGMEVKDTISELEAFDVSSEEVLSISNDACEFGYRESRFKRDWVGNKIITSVHFTLSKEKALKLDYPALAQNLTHDSSLKQVFDEVVSIRTQKLPDPKQIPNAGSFFKNPVVSVSDYQALQQRYPDIVAFEHGQKMKLAAAWLIEQAGWKQKQVDGVRVHQHQALVVINPERRPGEAIQGFAQALKDDIQQRYGVMLEVEPRLIRLTK